MNDQTKYIAKHDTGAMDGTIAGIRGLRFDDKKMVYTLHEAGVEGGKAYVILSPANELLGEVITDLIENGQGTFNPDDIRPEYLEREQAE